jgi:hypothetical protein
MTCRRLQFFRTATRNIDPAKQVTRLNYRRVIFLAIRIANLIHILGSIFAIRVLVRKYPCLWNAIHWSASPSCAHWRMETVPGNVSAMVPRLRTRFRVELHLDMKYRPYWSEQATARSRLVNIDPYQVDMWVPSGSFDHASLSPRNDRKFFVAEISA